MRFILSSKWSEAAVAAAAAALARATLVPVVREDRLRSALTQQVVEAEEPQTRPAIVREEQPQVAISIWQDKRADSLWVLEQGHLHPLRERTVEAHFMAELAQEDGLAAAVKRQAQTQAAEAVEVAHHRRLPVMVVAAEALELIVKKQSARQQQVIRMQLEQPEQLEALVRAAPQEL
jgi:hypothetical protein